MKPAAPVSGWTPSLESQSEKCEKGQDNDGRRISADPGRRRWSVKWAVSVVLLCAFWWMSQAHDKRASGHVSTKPGRITSCIHWIFGSKHDPETVFPGFDGKSPVVTLAPLAFSPLPLGSIKPQGWVKDQMTLMSHGLAGNQFEFYHIVRNSPWLGGNSEYSVLNEGLPYWLNGLVPLAYGLNDTRLIRQVEDASDLVLNHQHSDGWLGPEVFFARDIWARFPFCLGLIQLVEGDPSRAAKIVPALYRFIRLMHDMLVERIGFDQQWGRVRYADMMITLQWLYEKYPQKNERLLLSTMHLLKSRSMRWEEYWTERNYIFEDLDLITPPITDQTEVFPFVHGVNAVQGLKSGAVLNRFMFDDSLVDMARRAVNWTLKYHGDPAGSVIGDERESGKAPNRGTELCTTVELMYSLSYLYQAIGDKSFADQCELAAFNALPVSITGDHWRRQYIALPNEPMANSIDEPTPFWNVKKDGLVYSLERNYPCCTVNMPQGLPKFLSASFVRAGENGIAHALLSPASVSTTTTTGTQVSITCNTTYPFGSVLHYSVSASAPFTLFLRVPSWHLSSGSSITVNGSNNSYPLNPSPHTGMTPVTLPAGKSEVTFTLAAEIRIEPRSNGSISVYHGALLYALDVGQLVTEVPVQLFNATYTYPEVDGPPTIPDHVQDLTFINAKPWNVAIDLSTLVYHAGSDERPIEPLENPIFDYEAPPNFITGKGCQIHWETYDGLPLPLPKLPEGAEWKCISNVTDIVLRPYGSLKIHMSELPTVDLRTSANMTSPTSPIGGEVASK